MIRVWFEGTTAHAVSDDPRQGAVAGSLQAVLSTVEEWLREVGAR